LFGPEIYLLKILNNRKLKAQQKGLLRRVSRSKLIDHMGNETLIEQRIEVTEKCRTQWRAQVESMVYDTLPKRA
jgi:hypothetical protein